MKPVAIFRHLSIEGPGHFATFLERHSVPSQLIAVDQGETIPKDPTVFSGLCFMGGPMSVNDPLPWIGDSLELIRAAVGAGIPVIGHCLGGQLLAKALGGEIGPNPVKEIGWGPVSALPCPEATRWLGSTQNFTAFHWHGETFAIPPSATHILGSPHCANQGFVAGPHLAMQCHVEMTLEMIGAWASHGAAEIARRRPQDAIQSGDEMLGEAPLRLPSLHDVADRLYARWAEGLAR